jgi:glycosyltransferase involved in cell wall biosynthesis
LTVVFGGFHEPIHNRGQCWKQYGDAMKRVEQILARESFDLMVYLLADFVLPFLSLRSLRARYPGHFRLGVRGLVFRNMGLRPAPASWRQRLNAILDRFVLRRALQAGALRKLSFLDPRSADRARQLFSAELCGRGIDPVAIPRNHPATARDQLGFTPADFVLLMFGSIDERKGALETLAILRDAKMADPRLVVVIAGQVDPELKEPLGAIIQGCAGLVRVILHDRFLSEEELAVYFSAADCVACPYRNFTASSGVLLHGASCGKPALVSPGGVMEDAVREFGFGEVVTVEDPTGFIASLRRLMNLSAEERAKMSAGALAYARSRDERLFMSQFLTAAESQFSAVS